MSGFKKILETNSVNAETSYNSFKRYVVPNLYPTACLQL